MKIITVNYLLILLLTVTVSFSCAQNVKETSNETVNNSTQETENADENKYLQIKNIPLPEGFTLLKNEGNSFATWLENVPLKKDKTVYLFDGTQKQNQSAQFAVLDIDVSTKNLQQCADAVMRLRAEYLFAQQKFNDILFTDNDGTKYQFNLPYNRTNFTSYLERVFGMCGSASLSKQLKAVNDFSNIKAGDVLIKGGFPGHAVIIMLVAKNDTGNKIYLMAQSYMPAQDIHVLQNPSNKNLSPWYEVNEEDKIITPEYLFYKNQLKEW